MADQNKAESSPSGISRPWFKRTDVLGAAAIIAVVAIYLIRGTPSSAPLAATPTPAPAQTADTAAFRKATEEGLHYYFNTKEYAKAEQAFRKSIDYAPMDAMGYNNLGSALNDQKKWDEAITVLNRAVQLNPNFAIARNNLAFALAQKAKMTQ